MYKRALRLLGCFNVFYTQLSLSERHTRWTHHTGANLRVANYLCMHPNTRRPAIVFAPVRIRESPRFAFPKRTREAFIYARVWDFLPARNHIVTDCKSVSKGLYISLSLSFSACPNPSFLHLLSVYQIIDPVKRHIKRTTITFTGHGRFHKRKHSQRKLSY